MESIWWRKSQYALRAIEKRRAEDNGQFDLFLFVLPGLTASTQSNSHLLPCGMPGCSCYCPVGGFAQCPAVTTPMLDQLYSPAVSFLADSLPCSFYLVLWEIAVPFSSPRAPRPSVFLPSSPSLHDSHHNSLTSVLPQSSPFSLSLPYSLFPHFSACLSQSPPILVGQMYLALTGSPTVAHLATFHLSLSLSLILLPRVALVGPAFNSPSYFLHCRAFLTLTQPFSQTW